MAAAEVAKTQAEAGKGQQEAEQAMRDGAVLIVEDNDSDFLLMRHALVAGGIRNAILAARDGRSALKLLEEEPILILLDLGLPGMGGLELISTIRSLETGKTIPIIVSTGSNIPDDEEASLAAGANGFLRKPVSFDAFMEAIFSLGFSLMIVSPNDG